MAVITLKDSNFEQEVLASETPVLVDFWAPWCTPCRMLSPTVDTIAQEQAGRIKVGKVNIDEQPELAERFRVMSIPTLMVFKDGRLVDSTVGVQPKPAILRMLAAGLPSGSPAAFSGGWKRPRPIWHRSARCRIAGGGS